jgi:AraC-like DNA-binding protein
MTKHRAATGVDPVDELSVRPDALQIVLRELPGLGLDPAALMREVGLRPTDAGERPSAAAVFRVYGLAAQALGDPWLGVRVGARRGLSWLGPYGTAITSASCVGHALAIASRYSELLVDGLRLRLEHHGPVASLGQHMVEGLDPVGTQVVHQSSVLVSANVHDELIGRPDVLRTLSFACPPPTDPAVLEPIRRPWRVLAFDAPRWALSVPAASLRLPLQRSPSPEVAAVLEQLEAEREQLRTRQGFVARLRLVLLGRLSEGPSVAAAARELKVSPRTLQWRLGAAGTSFQAELDRVRLDVARRYLRGTRDPIALIAARVGFEAPAGFTRFFRAAAGQTPRAYRERAAAA